MKEVFTVLLIHLLSSVCGQSYQAIQELKQISDDYSVDDNGNVTYIRIYDSLGLSAQELFSRTLAFFTYNYMNGESVIQIEDKEKGQIIGKGLYANLYTGQYWTNLYEYDSWHVLRVDVKDGRARAVLTLTEYRSRNVAGDQNGITEKITACYPFEKKGVAKNHYANAFLESHKRVQATFDKLGKALKEGSVGGDAEKKDW